VFSLLAFVGCSPSISFVEPEWTAPPSKVRVLITKPHVRTVRDLKDDLPEYQDNFSTWFQAQFRDALTQKAKIPVEIMEVSDSLFVMDTSVVGNEEIEVPRPLIPLKGEITLCISDITIDRYSYTSYSDIPMGTGMGTGMVPIQHKSLRFVGFYAYFDSHTGQRLAYGKVVADANYDIYINLDDWKYDVQQMVSDIVKGTPLRK